MHAVLSLLTYINQLMSITNQVQRCERQRRYAQRMKTKATSWGRRQPGNRAVREQAPASESERARARDRRSRPVARRGGRRQVDGRLTAFTGSRLFSAALDVGKVARLARPAAPAVDGEPSHGGERQRSCDGGARVAAPGGGRGFGEAATAAPAEAVLGAVLSGAEGGRPVAVAVTPSVGIAGMKSGRHALPPAGGRRGRRWRQGGRRRRRRR